MSKGLKKDKCRCYFFIRLILFMSFFCIEYPVYANILDEVIKDSSYADLEDRFDTLLFRPDFGIDPNVAIISNETIDNLEKSIAFYKRIVDKGGWPQLSESWVLRLGSSGSSVQKLRERLIISGDLDPTKRLSSIFDSYVESAVKHFQVRHGLYPDGVLTVSTIQAMNVSADLRIQQLHVNLVRIRGLLEKKMGSRYVVVNIPAADVNAIDNGKVVLRSIAIVGRIDRQTPLLHSQIRQIILNPHWVIPRSIIKKDVMELMRVDPLYLDDNNIRLINEHGVQVRPEDVDWNAPEAPNLIFRQDPGKINAMASTKIEFYSKNNVYMHDTPEPTLFSNVMRFETSGCIRISNIISLSTWLLKDTPGWSRHRIEEIVKTRKTTFVNLAQEVPVHFIYVSAWSAKGPEDLVVHFRDDVYGWDHLNVEAASVPLPNIIPAEPTLSQQ
ncbi:MAG: amidase [Candidatus Liberibacter ctenarytainae]|uniref:Amidase n=1 Tax=Candidatus Liberibacter ctenarytainae TaxID=2020335 RepID=A0A937AIX1_9HYPH|nr:amidase [Candidatus Liberibacter ctenarytainae]